MQKVNNDVYDTYGDRWYEADDDPVALLRAESKTKTPWIVSQLKQYGYLTKETKVLDVGCGAGFLSNALAKQGVQVTGVDLSEESLKVAHKYDETKTVHYQSADAYKLPFEDSSFDVLTAMDFLEHVEHPDQIIIEFSRVLKPGGVFIFHTFNRNFLAYIVIIKFVEWLVKNTPKHLHVLRLFIKPKELSHYCELSGMKVKAMTGIKPVFSTIPIRHLFSGIVPKSLRFELTKSLLLSYMGIAQKNRS
ncbi:MAG: 3-demethylubiquinone-9 3-O-methyltransferase [Bdellovibrio sp.]|nr:3-demethylubiquinone-9 3-O-methyltransferase [Bdellovibrio sp.]